MDELLAGLLARERRTQELLTMLLALEDGSDDGSGDEDEDDL